MSSKKIPYKKVAQEEAEPIIVPAADQDEQAKLQKDGNENEDPGSTDGDKSDKLEIDINASLSGPEAAAPSRNFGAVLKDGIASVALPLSLLITIGFFPKFLIVWIAVIVLKPLCGYLYLKSPQSWRQNFQNHLPGKVKNSPVLQELADGAELGLPFVLFFVYLICAPFALIWILVDWLRSVFPQERPEQKGNFVLTQNKRLHPVHAETNFYNSRSFSLVIIAFFASGVPAFCSYSIFEKLAVDKMLSSPLRSIPAKYMHNTFNFNSVPKAAAMSPLSPQGQDATAVVGYHGNWPWLANFGIKESKRSFFLLHFYFVSLASALSVLFFRSWFTFPLNFAGNEHDVELSETGIRRNNFKSWFRSLLTLNGWSTGDGPNRLSWANVKSLRYWQDGGIKLSPLPENIFKKESLSYKLLNKAAVFFDGLTSNLTSGDYLVFSTAKSGSDFGRHIKISLKDLSREQRVRLFHSAKTWAPHLYIPARVEQELLGSVVLREAKYTELWFDLLSSDLKKPSQSCLESGELLNKGRYKIDRYLKSGGQANVYLACDQGVDSGPSGKPVVLKEFILSGSKASGAFLESAHDFESELSLLSQLEHPGIVKLLDFFSRDGRVYAVLEHVEGLSLREQVKLNGALSQKQVIEMAISICEILEYLHRQVPAVVHRDVSPENIILGTGGKITLVDFSLAVRKDNSAARTESCAKQCFTAAEQFRGEINPQSDIYSLGASMFFLLSGQLPKPISVSSPKTVNSSVSDELNRIIEQATELDLSKRYESVSWMKLELMKLI